MNKTNQESQSIQGYHIVKHSFGSGSFGHVSLCQRSDSPVTFAMKFVPDSQWDDSERKCLASLKHPNVLGYRDYFRLWNTHHLITEYAAGGDLFDYLDGKPRIDEETARGFFRQLVSAMIYVHSSGITHRDLKLENIFLDKDKRRVIIGDWGFATTWSYQKPLRERCGTLYYLAPEIIQGRAYHGPEVDTWSLGVLLFYLIVGRLPFDGGSDNETERMICDCNPILPAFLSASVRDLFSQLLSPVDRRPTLSVIANHPWLTGQTFFASPPLLQSLAAAATLDPTKKRNRRSSSSASFRSQHFSAAEILLSEHDAASSSSGLGSSLDDSDIFLTSDDDFEIFNPKRKCSLHRRSNSKTDYTILPSASYFSTDLSFSSYSTPDSLFSLLSSTTSPDDFFF